MAPPFEPAVRAVVDRFAGDFERIVVGGMSYGGTFALRAAAQDDRIAACFAVSSGYSAAGRYERFHPLTQAGLRHYMAGDPADVERAITVEGVRVDVPVLQVYGGRDRITPVADAQRVADELGGPVETVVSRTASTSATTSGTSCGPWSRSGSRTLPDRRSFVRPPRPGCWLRETLD